MAQEIKKPEPPPGPAQPYTDPFSAMRAEMNRVFDSFFGGGFGGGFGRLPARTRGGWDELMVPSIDVRETDKDFVIEAELPGMDEKDVSVTLSNGVLTLRGEKKSEREEKEENYHLSERSYGSFHRSFELGDGVDPDKVQASFEKGVLKVTLAKRPEVATAARQIPISKA